MAHFALLWKARSIEKHRQKYENEKINSILMSNADLPGKTLFQRWRHYSHDVQKRLSRKFSKWYPEGSTISNFLVNFRAEMRFSHILLRSLFGFIGGLVLTYLCFVFIVFQLSLSIVRATVLSSLFGVVITLGLTFSNRMRCLVFLLIPQLFSRAGRYTLTCYVLVLLLTGPATNTLKNSEVLSESMACTQEQTKTSVRELNESIKKPYNSIKDSIKLMVEHIKLISMRLRSVVLSVNRLIFSIASLIQSNFSWLESVADSCNDQLGTPYERCIAILKKVDTSQSSQDKTHWYINADTVAKVACGSLDCNEKFCIAADFAGETFYATVKRKLKIFTKRLSKILYLKIRTHHSYTFIGNTSSPSQVAAGIVTEIRSRADPILTWLSWSSCVTSLFLLLIIFRAKYYLHMYETRSRFDNRYITKEFLELDLKRLREGRETVLPLSKRERAKYVTTTSFRLVSSEKIYLHRSAVFMVITTFKLMIHVVADYSLYWVLMTIRHHGSLQSPLQPGPLSSGAHITGNGFVSRLLQSLLDTLNIPLQSSYSSSDSCLPDPHTPDFKKYIQIGILIVLLWVFALFEPYGLRMRHMIMGHYNPERAQTRAVWLYNHILRTRGSFMKFARRKLHREYKYAPEYDLTFRYWIRSLIPFEWLRCLLGIHLKQPHCLLCLAVENKYDVNTALTRCEVPKCPGIYCSSCFADIGQMCTICLSPEDYGDLSDASLEKGSSDEDYKRDDDDSINENEGNAYSACGTKKIYDISTSKYESDNDTDNSVGHKAIDHGMFHLLCMNIDINEKTNPINNTRIDFENDDKTIAQTKNNIVFTTVKSYKSIETSKLKRFSSNINISTYIYFSFVRITLSGMTIIITKDTGTSKKPKVLRRRKGTKIRKKNELKKNLALTTCNNDKGDESHKVKQDDHENKKSEAKKINRDEKTDTDAFNKKANRDMSNKSKKGFKEDAVYERNTNNSRKGKLQQTCSKCWNNIYKALSCSNITDRHKNLTVTIEEKKHKVKKKYEKSKASPKTLNNTRNNEDARQYRISTFFADQDWKKTGIDYNIKDKNPPNLQTEVEVNNIKIPMLNLQFSSESVFVERDDEDGPSINTIIISDRDSSSNNDCMKSTIFTEGALKRFFERMNSDNLSDKELDVSNENNKRKLWKLFCNSKFSLMRSMKFFNSESNSFINEPIQQQTYFQKNPIKMKCSLEDDNIAKPKSVNIEKKTPKEVIEDLGRKQSETKRKLSTILGFGFRGPLSVFKDLYISLFPVDNSTPSQECNKTKPDKFYSDKEVAVFPNMQSWGCQKCEITKSHSHCFPCNCHKKKAKMFLDAQVDPIVHPTCTCATQHYTPPMNFKKYQDEYDDYVIDIDNNGSKDSTISSEKSDKTDTTVYSLAAVDYHNMYPRRINADTTPERESNVKSNRRMKVKVVTKANRSTLTDTANVCDVSTLTYDWWSPIVEKKAIKKEIALEKKDGDTIMGKKKERTVRNRGINADVGKIVTFRSRAQIIPRDSHVTIENILSPSRYLLESQKYYNELFASKFYSPHLYPVSHATKYPRARSPVNSRLRSRRGRRNKRLDESYTPRKQATPRRRVTETSKYPDSTYQVRRRRT